MLRGRRDSTSGERGISTVVGTGLIVAMVVALSVTTITMFSSLSQAELGKTDPQNIGQYALEIESGGDVLVIRPRATADLGDDTAFELVINGQTIRSWDGTNALQIRCLYPGDSVLIRSENDGRTSIVQQHYFDRMTNCDEFNTFPDKFQHAKIKTENESSYHTHEINDRYAFGLGLDPDGANTFGSGEIVGSNSSIDFGPISMANRWHYVEQYDREVEGLEPPVFVVVMTDNVHMYDRPHPSEHPEINASEEYNWTDAPPDGFVPENTRLSFDVDPDGNMTTSSEDVSEPTNDVFLVFKPGCTESSFKFISEEVSYNNDVYLNDTMIIDNVNTATTGTVFAAPGVKCRGDATWE
jgi:hypothetical protein